eukprot:3593146-Ditylum_brightwellii.AAC.1
MKSTHDDDDDGDRLEQLLSQTIAIFTKWEGPGGAQESVLGYKNNYHKKFYGVEEALQFIKMHITK